MVDVKIKGQMDGKLNKLLNVIQMAHKLIKGQLKLGNLDTLTFWSAGLS